MRKPILADWPGDYMRHSSEALGTELLTLTGLGADGTCLGHLTLGKFVEGVFEPRRSWSLAEAHRAVLVLDEICWGL